MAMWYPEEQVCYCRQCRLEVPVECVWRGRGWMVNSRGEHRRTIVLHSVCPECGRKRSVGLDGPWWYRQLYRWLWRMRYPATAPPGWVAQLMGLRRSPPVKKGERRRAG
jgi:hypothetical protein